MIAPIFAVCSVDAQVIALLGSKPVRLFPFGRYDDTVIYPYAVWQNIGGQPEAFLNQRPDLDTFSLQVDAYADTDEEAISVARALRDAIEPHAYITRWGGQEIDPETKRYRYSFDVDWKVSR